MSDFALDHNKYAQSMFNYMKEAEKDNKRNPEKFILSSLFSQMTAPGYIGPDYEWNPDTRQFSLTHEGNTRTYDLIDDQGRYFHGGVGMKPGDYSGVDPDEYLYASPDKIKDMPWHQPHYKGDSLFYGGYPGGEDSGYSNYVQSQKDKGSPVYTGPRLGEAEFYEDTYPDDGDDSTPPSDDPVTKHTVLPWPVLNEVMQEEVIPGFLAAGTYGAQNYGQLDPRKNISSKWLEYLGKGQNRSLPTTKAPDKKAEYYQFPGRGHTLDPYGELLDDARFDVAFRDYGSYDEVEPQTLMDYIAQVIPVGYVPPAAT